MFDNLPLIFAVGVAIGMAKKEKEVSALSAVIAYFVMNTAINAMLTITGQILENGEIAESVLEGTITSVCGIQSLQMGVFGGIIVGLGVAALHNRFYRIQLPNALSFFGGTRFVPIISTIVYMFVGILMYFVWPVVQNGIYALGGLVTGSGYAGTLIFGLIKRALIPFGLHHVFYMPFWQTAVGGYHGSGRTYGAGRTEYFLRTACGFCECRTFQCRCNEIFLRRIYFYDFRTSGSGTCHVPLCETGEEKSSRRSASFRSTCVYGNWYHRTAGILFPVCCTGVVCRAGYSCGNSYMIAHILNIAVGLTFSGGLLDFFLFGILQGNEKTSWMRVIPVGILYFFLYYFIFKFMIKKFDFKTPGREDDDVETKLYTKADVNARKEAQSDGVASEDAMSEAITKGLGGKKNISDVDCCATRLRCTVHDAARVSDGILKATGASGVVHKGNGVQVIYGPNVTVIKSNLEDYLEKAPNTYAEAENAPAQKEAEPAQETKEQKVVDTITVCSPISGLAADLSTAPG